MELCNRTSNRILAAMARTRPDGLESRGWWVIDANQCVRAVDESLITAPHYVFAEMSTPDGVRTLTASTVFCTARSQFAILGNENCEARRYRRRSSWKPRHRKTASWFTSSSTAPWPPARLDRQAHDPLTRAVKCCSAGTSCTSFTKSASARTGPHGPRRPQPAGEAAARDRRARAARRNPCDGLIERRRHSAYLRPARSSCQPRSGYAMLIQNSAAPRCFDTIFAMDAPAVSLTSDF